MSAGTHGEVTLHMQAAPDAVYALVADVTRMGEWSPETASCEWADGATGPAVGARFRARNKKGVLRWGNKPEVVTADAGREFAFKRKAVGSEVVWRYRFVASGDGTDVTESFDVTKPMNPVLERIIDLAMGVSDRNADLTRGMRETLERIKAAAESAPTG